MHKALFWVSFVMFLLSIAHLGLVVQQVAVAKISPPNLRTRIILANIQFILGDIVLIWRVWVVWGHNCWVALGPFVTLLVASGFIFYSAAHLNITSFFYVVPVAMMVANTGISTLLIAGRVWYARYQVRQISGDWVYPRRFSKTVILFVETGALITASQIISLILNHVNSPGIHILLDLQMPLIGILPTLIIVLVHFELVGPATSRSSQLESRGMNFETHHVAQLDTFISSIAPGEDAGRSAKLQGIGVV